MLKLAFTTAALSSLLFVASADASSPRRPVPAPAAPSGPGTMQPIPNPPGGMAKQKDCEGAWQRQRIKKGSKKAFIRACVRHG